MGLILACLLQDVKKLTWLVLGTAAANLLAPLSGCTQGHNE